MCDLEPFFKIWSHNYIISYRFKRALVASTKEHSLMPMTYLAMVLPIEPL